MPPHRQPYLYGTRIDRLNGHVANAFEEHRDRSINATQSILDRLVSQVLAPSCIDSNPCLNKYEQVLSRQQAAHVALNHSRFGF